MKKVTKAKKATQAKKTKKIATKTEIEDTILPAKTKRKPRAAKTVVKAKTTKKTVVEKKVKRKPRATKSKVESLAEQSTEAEASGDIVAKPEKRKARASKKKVQKEKPATTPKKSSQVRSDVHPEVNIGTAGHVDEGKSTLIKLITGKFPDEHSEELRRGITIRLGYADCDFYRCPNCEEPENWSITQECPGCNETGELVRRVSFVDAPGHEILMQVMLSGAAIMDGVMLVIAANNKVPQPQTREHLAALTALGIDKIVIVQNKVELVSAEEAKQNYLDIKNFLQGTIAENAPIIPMSAMHGANLDLLLSALHEFIPTPERDLDAPMRMHVARSFDINRPGTQVKFLKGGVLGGSLMQGKVRVGDEIVILPGLKRRVGRNIEFIPVKTRVESIRVGTTGKSEEGTPGGLIALQTNIDPSMARSDNLAGSVVSTIGAEPPVIESITLHVNLFDSVVGSEIEQIVTPIAPNEKILLTIGTGTAVATVEKIQKKGLVAFSIRPRIALDVDSKVALSRQFNKRWRLIGWGEINDYEQIRTKITN